MTTDCCRRGALGSLRSRKRACMYLTASLAYDGRAPRDARGSGEKAIEGTRRDEGEYRQTRPKAQRQQTTVPGKTQCFRWGRMGRDDLACFAKMAREHNSKQEDVRR
ncbi:hypothetical protein TRVL_02346 [Trypanosoma vivax]|nr:hypothetical protein TRVL_02346 [Trypanosoma vivax]